MNATAPLQLGQYDFDVLHQLAHSHSIDQLHTIAGQFGQTLGFERWIYGIAGPDAVLADKYPHDWIEGYVRNRLHRGSDPILEAVGERRYAIHWDLRLAEPFRKPLTPGQKTILADRWHFGARHGVTAPVFDSERQPFDFGVLSFTRKKPLTCAEQQHHEPRVQLFATYFHNVASALVLGPTIEPATEIPNLAPREYDCLSWAAMGKSNWEISLLVGVSQATVAFHLSNAARKLRARGRIAAIAKATRLKLIDPC
jgi:DNA-binding CsgD family transcriptional regulator